MHAPAIDIDKFGWNASKTNVSFSNNVLIFRQRGFLFAGIFFVIALVPGIALYNEGVDYSALSIFLAVLTVSLLTVALLYAIYVQVIELDFNTRTFVIKNGFLGSVNVYRGPFGEQP